ncbi:MAG: SDR family NAD(P)-dependent oxidoreductase [Deltaproteobacteria bacterium]|nr:SDR family NAD(P)-dependent oxidoreductase [Deltaproteobacteria bacterium]
MVKLDVKHKVVLITGSSRGIGKALSRCFAADGANLALADLPSQKNQLNIWARELETSYGIKTWTFGIDLTETDGPERLYDQVIDSTGGINILVNNAGICWYSKFYDIPQDKLEQVILLNCMAYAKLSRLFLTAMIRKNEGAILNVSSVAAFQPLPTLALYAATKAFTQSLSEAICYELPLRSKVVVATLNPPFTKTSLIEDAGIPDDFIPFSISFKDIDCVVESGYQAFKSGKRLYVPGWQNKLLHLGLARYVPRRFANRVAWLCCRRWSDILPFGAADFFQESLIKRKDGKKELR